MHCAWWGTNTYRGHFSVVSKLSQIHIIIQCKSLDPTEYLVNSLLRKELQRFYFLSPKLNRLFFFWRSLKALKTSKKCEWEKAPDNLQRFSREVQGDTSPTGRWLWHWIERNLLSKVRALSLNLPESSACDSQNLIMRLEGLTCCCSSLFQKSMSDRPGAPAHWWCTNHSAFQPGGGKNGQNKVCEEPIWGISLCKWEGTCHFMKCWYFKAWTQIWPWLMWTGQFHHLKENSSFPSPPNGGERHLL